MSASAKVADTRRFWKAIYVYHKRIFPSGLALVFFRALAPIVRRVITILVMLGALRVFLREIDANGAPNGGFFESATPILFGIGAFLTLPPAVDFAVHYFQRRTRNKLRGLPLRKMARQLGCDPAQLRAWYKGQDRLLTYLLALPVVYTLLLGFAAHAWIAFVISELIFWAIVALVGAGLVAPSVKKQPYFAVEFTAYLTFSIYVLVLAFLLFEWPVRVHMEVLFLIIMMPRIQYANMRRAARFVLNTKDAGDDEDRET